MKLLNFLKRKKTPELGVSKVNNLGKSKKKKYLASCVIEYNGKNIGVFKVTEIGYSSSMVAKGLEEGLKIKVSKINLQK